MGKLKDILKGKRVYFDANIFIYILEGNPSLTTVINDLRDLIFQGDITVTSCDLIYTEILPFHARKKDYNAIEHIIEFISKFEISPITKQVFIHAGILRGETGMKTPDALHVVSAIQNSSEVFLTNDTGIKTPSNITRVLISDFI